MMKMATTRRTTIPLAAQVDPMDGDDEEKGEKITRRSVVEHRLSASSFLSPHLCISATFLGLGTIFFVLSATMRHPSPRHVWHAEGVKVQRADGWTSWETERQPLMTVDEKDLSVMQPGTPPPVEPGAVPKGSGGSPIPSYIPCSWPSGGIDAGLVLIKGGRVFTPEDAGDMDILIGGGKVLGLLPPQSSRAGHLEASGLCRVVNASGSLVTPGFVDIHVHVTGGGGESGPESKVPEAQLSSLVRAGLTTVVGVLGTDSLSRSPMELLTKVNALNRAPMTAKMWTGAYKASPQVPTLSGSVDKDIAFLDSCIGVKTAVSDHRGSQESAIALRELAAQARVAGMIGSKAGLVYAHMGDAPGALAPLLDIVSNTPIPISQLLPTHMGRTELLVQEGVEWIKRGGRVDVTAGSGAANVVKTYEAMGADMSAVSVSSDAYGSMPKFNEAKELVAYTYARPSRILSFVRTMVLRHEWPLEKVLPLVTSNPARFTGLHKGTISVGGDADLLIIDQDLGEPSYVIAKGLPAKTPTCVSKGMFE